MNSTYRIVLLDLGGVLLRLNDPCEIFDVGHNREQFLENWLHSPAVRSFECGDIDAAHFSKTIVEELHLPYSAEEFMRRFDQWPDELYPGAESLLKQLRESCETALLSNTNAVHRDGAGKQLGRHVDHLFLSFQTGLLKPDKAIFEHALAHYSSDGSDVMFLDDNKTNVEAARECGIESHQTVGFDALLERLRESGLI